MKKVIALVLLVATQGLSGVVQFVPQGLNWVVPSSAFWQGSFVFNPGQGWQAGFGVIDAGISWSEPDMGITKFEPFGGPTNLEDTIGVLLKGICGPITVTGGFGGGGPLGSSHRFDWSCEPPPAEEETQGFVPWVPILVQPPVDPMTGQPPVITPPIDPPPPPTTAVPEPGTGCLASMGVALLLWWLFSGYLSGYRKVQ